MQRGIVSLSNPELSILHALVVSQNCDKKEMLDKFSPVEGNLSNFQLVDVFVNEAEAEMLLDCMAPPGKDDEPNLVSVRLKLQQFLAKKNG